MIYVHVPFCRSFCTYCGFYSEVASKCRGNEDALKQKTLFEGYVQALETEIRTRHEDISRVFASGDVNTLYIGGGTPSVLPLSSLERLMAALRSAGHSGSFDEFTVEVNPEDIVEKGSDYVEGLLSMGVNRISMGVQSFDDGILKWMNRRHSASQAVKAYDILEDAGVENISIDLIFGLSQMADGLWKDSVLRALDISSSGSLPKHISAYQLSVEEGSMLEKLIAKGRWREASDEECSRQYDILCETLAEAGYHHYEISNFALPGYEAVHNSAYWRHVPYVGLGPGAHSFMDYLSMRRWNAPDLKAYVEAGKSGDFSTVQGGEHLCQDQLMMEKIMLGLRTSAGIPEQYVRRHCDGPSVEEALSRADLVLLPDGNVRIPENRFFVSDNIISSII